MVGMARWQRSGGVQGIAHLAHLAQCCLRAHTALPSQLASQCVLRPLRSTLLLHLPSSLNRRQCRHGTRPSRPSCQTCSPLHPATLRGYAIPLLENTNRHPPAKHTVVCITQLQPFPQH